MRNLLLSAFALVCLLPMNAQTVNTRIYPAEKLAKVKAKACLLYTSDAADE